MAKHEIEIPDIEQDGKVYEWTGEYRKDRKGDLYLIDGTVREVISSHGSPLIDNPKRFIMREKRWKPLCEECKNVRNKKRSDLETE